jgi:hypothetical protein
MGTMMTYPDISSRDWRLIPSGQSADLCNCVSPVTFPYSTCLFLFQVIGRYQSKSKSIETGDTRFEVMNRFLLVGQSRTLIRD